MMTDFERIGHYRKWSMVWLVTGAISLLAYRMWGEPVGATGGVQILSLLYMVPLLIGLSFSVRLWRLYRKNKACGDELMNANRDKAVRFAFLVSLLAILPLIVISVLTDLTALQALVAMEVVMTMSLAACWGWVELKQARAVSGND